MSFYEAALLKNRKRPSDASIISGNTNKLVTFMLIPVKIICNHIKRVNPHTNIRIPKNLAL